MSSVETAGGARILLRVDSTAPSELFPQVIARLPNFEANTYSNLVLLQHYNFVRPSLSHFLLFFLTHAEKALARGASRIVAAVRSVFLPVFPQRSRRAGCRAWLSPSPTARYTSIHLELVYSLADPPHLTSKISPRCTWNRTASGKKRPASSSPLCPPSFLHLDKKLTRCRRQ